MISLTAWPEQVINQVKWRAEIVHQPEFRGDFAKAEIALTTSLSKAVSLVVIKLSKLFTPKARSVKKSDCCLSN